MVWLCNYDKLWLYHLNSWKASAPTNNARCHLWISKEVSTWSRDTKVKLWPTSWSGLLTFPIPPNASSGCWAIQVSVNQPSSPLLLNNPNIEKYCGSSLSSIKMTLGPLIHSYFSLPLPNKHLNHHWLWNVLPRRLLVTNPVWWMMSSQLIKYKSCALIQFKLHPTQALHHQ